MPTGICGPGFLVVWRFILALLVFGLAMIVLKMVIVALVIGGLIFRPRETIALMLFFGLITLINVHPAAGLSLLGVLIIVMIFGAKYKKTLPQADRQLSLPLLDDPGEE